MIDNFPATLAGAAVAGGIGLATLYTQQQLDNRRRLNEEILAPAFNYVASLPTECPWSDLAEPEWSKLDSYHWLRIPSRYRLPLREMSNRLAAYGRAHAPYSEFMGETGWESFSGAVRSALPVCLVGDGSALKARSVGIDSGATIQVQLILVGVVPYVLTNPTNSDRAWDLLDKAGPSSFYWAKQVTQSLRKTDPPALQRLFDAISSNSNAPKGNPSQFGLTELVALSLPSRT